MMPLEDRQRLRWRHRHLFWQVVPLTGTSKLESPVTECWEVDGWHQQTMVPVGWVYSDNTTAWATIVLSVTSQRHWSVLKDGLRGGSWYVAGWGCPYPNCRAWHDQPLAPMDLARPPAGCSTSNVSINRQLGFPSDAVNSTPFIRSTAVSAS